MPKGVMLSHYSLVNNSLGILEVLQFSGERLFVNIPFHFTSCICHFLACSFSGSTMIGLEKKMLYADFSKTASSVHANGIGGGPIQLKWLVDYAKSLSIEDRKNLTFSGDFFISSGDRLSVEILNEAFAVLPNLKIFTVYGLTELGGRFCVLEPSQLKSNLDSVGKPINGLEIQIFDQQKDNEVGTGVEGEIVARGKLLSSGYFNNSKETQSSFRSYGFRTGDIGFIDEKGFVYVRGRTNDVFKVNGIKVSSQPIVEALLKSSFFDDAAVVPIQVPVFGTVPVAFCVLKKSVKFSKGKILNYLRSVLPNNHLPHEFILVDQIPRTGSGKVDRVKIKSIREP
jgi:fatty-acyl-CoA synthase